MPTNAQLALIAAALNVQLPPLPPTYPISKPEWAAAQHQQLEATLTRARGFLVWLNNEDRKEAEHHRRVSPDMTPDTTPEGPR